MTTAARGPVGSRVLSAVRGTGELLITAGLVLLLFCAYQLFWTNLASEYAQDQVIDELHEQWAEPNGVPAPTVTGTPGTSGTAGTVTGPGAAQPSGPVEVAVGDGLAILRIPRLGLDFAKPVVEGVEMDDLQRGVGHYPDTAMPGELGNFAVAGHRATNGEPFRDLDALQPGDALVVETRDTWFTYVVEAPYAGSGHRIVTPADTWVIDPVPGQEGAEPTRSLITLTTCNPRWASTERLIVTGTLESTQPKSEGLPPALEG